jgi:hypothetical protein
MILEVNDWARTHTMCHVWHLYKFCLIDLPCTQTFVMKKNKSNITFVSHYLMPNKIFTKAIHKYLNSYRSNIATVVTIALKGHETWPKTCEGWRGIQERYCPVIKDSWSVSLVTYLSKQIDNPLFSHHALHKQWPLIYKGPQSWRQCILFKGHFC